MKGKGWREMKGGGGTRSCRQECYRQPLKYLVRAASYDECPQDLKEDGERERKKKDSTRLGRGGGAGGGGTSPSRSVVTGELSRISSD